MHLKTRLLLVPTVALCGVVSVSTLAAATAPSGARGVTVARGVFPDGLDAKFKVDGHHGTQVARVKGPAQAVVQNLVIEPRGHTGWHSHPGPLMVVVSKGAVTLYDADDSTCSGHTYEAGEAFVDPGQDHAHIARNEGGTPAELWVTFLRPGDDLQAPLRVDERASAHCSSG